MAGPALDSLQGTSEVVRPVPPQEQTLLDSL